MAVVVREAQTICCASFAVDPTHVCIQTLRPRSTVKRRKRSDDVARRLCPAHTHIEILLRSAIASALSAPTPSANDANSLPGLGSRAKIMNQPQIDGVRIALRGSHLMKVLCGSRQVRQRNVLQKSLRLRRDQSWIQHVQLAVEVELLPRCRIEDRSRERGEIASSFGHRGNGGENVGR